MKTRKRFPKRRQKKRKTLARSKKHRKNRQRTKNKKRNGYGRGAMFSMMANDDYDEAWDMNIPPPPLPPAPPAPPPPPPLPPIVDPPMRFYFYRGKSRKRR